jgi:hypothetical protein
MSDNFHVVSFILFHVNNLWIVKIITTSTQSDITFCFDINHENKILSSQSLNTIIIDSW